VKSLGIREDIAGTLWPPADGPHGRLPPLLILLTIVTGLVDAFSYLRLGHVFVANMTGNVVFLGFALAGARGLSAVASLTAIAAFLVGSLAGGRLGARLEQDRPRLLRTVAAIKVVLVLVAAILAAHSATMPHGASRYVLIVLLALAMGIQNATARRLAVPDLTTTVLTLTLTGIASDSRLAGGEQPRLVRRLLSVGAMLLGALCGALLVLKVANWTGLAVACALLAIVGAAARRARTATE
jgi:uncharacterized membrane protein YoaK (UPF0700 family)